MKFKTFLLCSNNVYASKLPIHLLLLNIAFFFLGFLCSKIKLQIPDCYGVFSTASFYCASIFLFTSKLLIEGKCYMYIPVWGVHLTTTNLVVTRGITSPFIFPIRSIPSLSVSRTLFLLRSCLSLALASLALSPLSHSCLSLSGRSSPLTLWCFHFTHSCAM